MLGLIMCEGLSCLSAPSDHDSTLCPRVGVHIYISQTQINLRPASHQLCTSISSLPVAISLLNPTQPVISTSPSPEQQCLALLLHTAHWLQWLRYALHRTPDPFNLTTLCPSLCHRINHSSLCFPLAQSQDPANQKTWLMELSLLLTTWAPLSCCLRGTPPRTSAWCRPRRLSAGSRYSKTHTCSHPNALTHTCKHTHTLFGFWPEDIYIHTSTQSAGCVTFSNAVLFPLEGLTKKSQVLISGTNRKVLPRNK